MSNYIDRITLNGTTKIIRDTTLESKTAAENGTDLSLVTTGEKYTWNQGSSTKADKVSGAVSGNFAGLDANGNLTDSGHKHSDYITDVQTNGISVTASGVANIPMASDTTFGVVKVVYSDGITISANGVLGLKRATDSMLKTANDAYAVITAYFQHESVFYGLAKAAGDVTQIESNNAVGTYTNDAKLAIREMIGAGTYSMPAGGIPLTDLSSTVTSAISSKMEASLKGANNGVAELDSSGKVPSSQLPSFVDDVVEYNGSSNFPSTGETGKIYVDTSTNITYRWGGSSYVPIGSDLALGETSTTAYRGDRGKAAYDHASDASKVTSGYSSGLYKIAVTAEGHIASVTAVTKNDITGLGIPGSNAITDVQMNSSSIVSSGVANIPFATTTTPGVFISSGSFTMTDGKLWVNNASDSNIKAGTSTTSYITPSRQHMSAFYGLAAAAGDTTQASSNNAVGAYTDNAKSAIRTMIGAGTYSKPVGGIPASDLAADAISSMDVSVIAAGYDPDGDYSINGYCTNDGKLYKANTNISSETWDSTHWDETTVMEEIIARCSIIPAAGVSF